MHSDARPSKGLTAAAIGGLLFLHLPILLIFVYAFTTEDTSYRWPPPGFTLQWFGVAWNRSDVWEALSLSLRVAAISTAIALGSVRTLRRWLAIAVAEPENLEARGHILIAATTAGMAFDVAGVAIAHSIGHALGEAAGVHHGRAVGLALNATMANGAQAAPDAYAQVAEALGVDTRGMAPHEAAAAAPAAYDAWLREVGLKLSLDDHGLGAGDASRIAALCAEPANKTIMDNDSFAYTSEAIEAAVARLLAAA